jgi:hypothetical protein
VLLLDLMALAGRGGASPLRWTGTLLAVAFYSLVIWCYLRRGPARATTRSITAGAAAVVATWIPFVIPWLHGAPPGPVRQGVSDVLLLAGTAWAVWSLRSLGRNLSVIAQVRDVADGGRTGGSGTLCTPGRSCPRWARHRRPQPGRHGRLARDLCAAGLPGGAGGAAAAGGPARVRRLPDQDRGAPAGDLLNPAGGKPGAG